MTKEWQSQMMLTKKSFKQHHIVMAMCVAMGLGCAIDAQAKNVNPPTLRADAPNVYIVKKGDTLWDISGRFLKTPWRWPEIWASNKHVKNPHWIYPGNRLLLCTHDGRPLIGKDEGDGCEGLIRRSGGDTGVKLSPQIRVEALSSAIPVIPLEHIRVWLERSIVLSPDSLNGVPYVLGMTENKVMAAAGDRIYLRGNGIQSGERYAIYRKGEPYKVTDEHGKQHIVGVEFTQVASGLATQQQDGISTFEVSQTFNGEIHKGDFVLPEYDAMLPTLFYPLPVDDVTTGGEVIRVLGSIGTAAKHSVIAINRGISTGVQTGHVFALDQRGEIVNDPITKETIQLPNQRSGHALVFRTFDHISYAYVLDSNLPIKLGAALSAPLSEE